MTQTALVVLSCSMA